MIIECFDRVGFMSFFVAVEGSSVPESDPDVVQSLGGLSLSFHFFFHLVKFCDNILLKVNFIFSYW